MPDFSKGIQYMIVCNITGDTYYGSTALTLEERMKIHRKPSNRCTSRVIIERGDYTAIWLEDWPCNSKYELERRERWWIENNVCVNKFVPTGVDMGGMKSNTPEWRAKYRQLTKETLAKRQAKKITCEWCGEAISRSGISEHQRTQRCQRIRNGGPKYKSKKEYKCQYNTWQKSWDGLNKMDVF